MKFIIFFFFVVKTATVYGDLGAFFAQAELRHNIPKGLLKAMAFVESGTTRQGKNQPWPWTANVEGKTYYFNNQTELLRYVEHLQDQGVRSVDVGVMQINLKHHAHHFKTLYDCITPYQNIMYAGRFLKECFERTQCWNKAVARYHSGNPKYGNAYLSRVLKRWKTIQESPQKLFGYRGGSSPVRQFKQRFSFKSPMSPKGIKKNTDFSSIKNPSLYNANHPQNYPSNFLSLKQGPIQGHFRSLNR
jgi:hypothetical protein